MGKRAGEGRKSGVAGKKSTAGMKRSTMTGTRCQMGLVIYTSRREAEHASPRGKAKQCGRCRHWHVID